MPEMIIEMQQCIETCQSCHKICLETGGQHTEPSHFRWMMTCAEMYRTRASFMLTGSDLHTLTSGVYAEVCRRCADNCERVGDMDECVRRAASPPNQVAGWLWSQDENSIRTTQADG